MDLSTEKNLIKKIRQALTDTTSTRIILTNKNFNFDSEVSHVYITLFQAGLKAIRWGSKRETLELTLDRCIEKLKDSTSFMNFDIADSTKCRILIELITSEEPCNIESLSQSSLGNNRFEVGIDGLKLIFKNKEYYYMPTDATVKSHLSLKDIINFFAKKIGLLDYTDSISKRIEIIKLLELEWHKINSFAFVSYKDEVLALYRGLPILKDVNSNTLLEASKNSILWALKYQKDNGQFLYYYDAIKDSEVDHEHPKMLEPTYYNMLRHSGGIIALLHMYKVEPNPKYLKGIEKAIVYLKEETKYELVDGNTHAYVMCNSKAKLGGSGIALVALMMHYIATRKQENIMLIEALVLHILSRVDIHGEMIGYYIHPEYNENQPLLELTEKEKQELFSFYYPGEALLGLALYHNEMESIEPKFKEKITKKSMLALDFLVFERPKKYPEMFASLPSDSWLMQAIEMWTKNTIFQKEAYINFVYNDAKAMINQMYTPQNALYFDYIGAYHYYYGEHAYPDAARSEGLIAAYNLAKNLNNNKIAGFILIYLKLAAKNMMYVYNTEQSSFAHKNLQKSEGTFRLKYTRQWTRIDMTQHAVSFFIRYYLTRDKEEICQL